MAKIQVSAVAELLKKHKLKPELLREIVEEMNLMTQPADGEEKPPAQKKQFVVLLSDPTGLMKDRDKHNLVGWVVPEDASPFSTMDRVCKGAYDFNCSKRGRLLPVKSIGEALESAKYFREAELWVKTKMPVAIVVTDNVLPRDEFKVQKEPKALQLEAPALAPAVLSPGGSGVFLGGQLVWSAKGGSQGDAQEMEDLIRQAFAIVKVTRRASTSMLQRRLRIGYNRASSIMEALEKIGVVGPELGSSPREILVNLDTYELPKD